MNRRTFFKKAGAGGAAFALAAAADFCLSSGVVEAAENLLSKSKVNPAKRPNILCITADDLGYESLGVMGCKLPGISPNADKLAKEGVLFEHCYASTSICGPSRAAIMTGMYPQSNGFIGHGTMEQRPAGPWDKIAEPDSFTIGLHGAGYFTGRINKGGQGKAKWDYLVNEFKTAMGRDPNKYYQECKQFIEKAKTANKPFFLEANIDDPHGYWSRDPNERKQTEDLRKQGFDIEDFPDSKKDYDANEIPIPVCLPDMPDIRKYIKTYYDSVNRMDESLGAILKALKESGLEDDTLVLFLSDNGMQVTFAKVCLYPSGTRTPLIVRWPKKIKPGRVDKEHLIETVDLAATFLEAAGVQVPQNIQGHSLVLLVTTGKANSWRKYAFSCYNFMNFPEYVPSRAVVNQDFAYIWNAWSAKGIELPPTMSRDEPPIIAMRQSSDPKIKVRADYYVHRPVEEFFDLRKDPGCWNNLIEDKKYLSQINAARKELMRIMNQTNDWEAEYFKKTIMKD